MWLGSVYFMFRSGLYKSHPIIRIVMSLVEWHKVASHSRFSWRVWSADSMVHGSFSDTKKNNLELINCVTYPLQLYFCIHWLKVDATRFWIPVTSSSIDVLKMRNLIMCFCFCRVLLRVRLLYYLKQEVIGHQAEKIFNGANARLYIITSSLYNIDTWRQAIFSL